MAFGVHDNSLCFSFQIEYIFAEGGNDNYFLIVRFLFAAAVNSELFIHLIKY